MFHKGHAQRRKEMQLTSPYSGGMTTDRTKSCEDGVSWISYNEAAEHSTVFKSLSSFRRLLCRERFFSQSMTFPKSSPRACGFDVRCIRDLDLLQAVAPNSLVFFKFWSLIVIDTFLIRHSDIIM